MKSVNPPWESSGGFATPDDVYRVLDRMCEALGVSDHAALALALGRDEMTTRVWRHRKRIPPSVLTDVSQRSGRSVQWLTALEGSTEAATFAADKAKQVNRITDDEETLVLALRRAPPEMRAAITAMIKQAAKVGDPPKRGRPRKNG